MGALDQTQATQLLKAILTQTSTSSTTGMTTRLGSTVPTGTSTMTELSNGDGYTSGGTNTTWNTPSAGSSTNSTALSWTASGTSWTIEGVEVWDRAGTPLRWMYGSWTGEPISIANGNTFAVASAAMTATLS
jgi:hypothetical protein